MGKKIIKILRNFSLSGPMYNFSENTYSCTKTIDGDTVAFEILDTAAQVPYI